MIPEKWIYSFTLDKEVSVDKTEVSKDEAGAEIRITKSIKEKKPFSFKIKNSNDFIHFLIYQYSLLSTFLLLEV